MYAAIGVAEFRRYEEKALRGLATQPDRVIATGGGFVENPGSYDLVSRLGNVFFLDCGIDVLTARISAMPARPMFQKLGIRETLEILERERVGKYRTLSKHTVDVNQDSSLIVDEIIVWLHSSGREAI